MPDQQFAFAVRAALEESAFYATRRQRPPARLLQGSPERNWDVVTGRLLALAKTEYLGFDDPNVLHQVGMSERSFVRGSLAMGAMAQRGVQARLVTTHAGLRLIDESCPTVVRRNGGGARVVDRLPGKACIVDRTFALVPLDFAVLAHGLLIITDPVVINMLAAMHRSLWGVGVPPTGKEDGPPSHLRPVLAVLTSGLTDDRAAQRVGLSPRTYSRRVAELIRLLGATSRFEAGAEAARRDWL